MAYACEVWQCRKVHIVRLPWHHGAATSSSVEDWAGRDLCVYVWSCIHVYIHICTSRKLSMHMYASMPHNIEIKLHWTWCIHVDIYSIHIPIICMYSFISNTWTFILSYKHCICKHTCITLFGMAEHIKVELFDVYYSMPMVPLDICNHRSEYLSKFISNRPFLIEHVFHIIDGSVYLISM